MCSMKIIAIYLSEPPLVLFSFGKRTKIVICSRGYRKEERKDNGGQNERSKMAQK